MIQLLLDGYKKQELEKIKQIYENALSDFYPECHFECDKCNTKRLCRDLEKAIDFCEEYISIKFPNTQM